MDKASYIREQSEKTVVSEEPAIEGIRYSLKSVVVDTLGLPGDSPILDVGCRQGASIEVLREMGYTNVRGIDINPKNTALALRKGLNVRTADIHDIFALRDCDFFMPFSYSLIWARHVLEHTLNPIQALLGIKYLLKVGGHVHIIVPSTSRLEKYHHQIYHKPQTLESHVKSAGLKIIYLKHVPRAKGVNYQDEYWCLACKN